MDARFSQVAQEIGMMVVDGVQQVLSRVQADARVQTDPHAAATGVMDGMTHMLATCATWVINSRRGRDHGLNPEEAGEIYERLRSKLIDATMRLMEAEMSRLRQGEDPGAGDGNRIPA